MARSSHTVGSYQNSGNKTSGGSKNTGGGSSGGSSGKSWVDPDIYPKGVAKNDGNGNYRYDDGTPVREEIQAYMDWNYGRNGGNSDYRNAGGNDRYNREYDRLLSLKPGQNRVTGEYSEGYGGGDYTERTSVLGAYTDRAAEEARAAQEAARRGAFHTSVSNLGSQNENALRESYIRNQKAQLALPQQSQLMGGGGMSETTLAKMNTQYGNERTQMENAYLGAVAGLEADLNNGLAIDQSQYYDRLAQVAAQQRQEQLARDQMRMQLSEAQKDRELQSSLQTQRLAAKNSGTSESEEDKYNGGNRVADPNSTIYTAAGLYGDDGKGGSWTPGGKRAYVRMLVDQGLSDEEIQYRTAAMGW